MPSASRLTVVHTTSPPGVAPEATTAPSSKETAGWAEVDSGANITTAKSPRYFMGPTSSARQAAARERAGAGVVMAVDCTLFSAFV